MYEHLHDDDLQHQYVWVYESLGYHSIGKQWCDQQFLPSSDSKEHNQRWLFQHNEYPRERKNV